MRYRDSNGKVYPSMVQSFISAAKQKVDDFKSEYLPGMDTVTNMTELNDRYNGVMPLTYEERENVLADIVRGCTSVMIDYTSGSVIILDASKKPLAATKIDLSGFKEKIDGFIVDVFNSEKSEPMFVPRN